MHVLRAPYVHVGVAHTPLAGRVRISHRTAGPAVAAGDSQDGITFETRRLYGAASVGGCVVDSCNTTVPYESWRLRCEVYEA
jgi:hypothetical protein